MAIWQDRSQTKKTGGKTRSYRKSRKHDKGNEFSEPSIGDEKRVKKRTQGGNQKTVVKRTESVNVSVDGDVKNADIESVEENVANPNFVRRSLLTKGTIIQTSEGKAKVTSRPGQDGVVNAKLVQE